MVIPENNRGHQLQLGKPRSVVLSAGFPTLSARRNIFNRATWFWTTLRFLRNTGKHGGKFRGNRINWQRSGSMVFW